MSITFKQFTNIITNNPYVLINGRIYTSSVTTERNIFLYGAGQYAVTYTINENYELSNDQSHIICSDGNGWSEDITPMYKGEIKFDK